MADVVFVPNHDGVIKFLNGDKMESIIGEAVAKIAESASSKGSATYVSDVQKGRYRIHGQAKTSDAHSAWVERSRNNLLKSMDAGRL